MNDVSSFWARRKAAVAAEEAEHVRAVQQAKQAEEIAGKDDAEILADMGLPDPDHMEAGDDFVAFMSREVPEHLRKRALRTLWRSNPVLANVDGLNDYDDDFRVEMLGQAPFKTAYQVGKGMTAHLDELARQARLREDAADGGPEGEIDEPVAEVTQTVEAVQENNDTPTESVPAYMDETAEDEAAPTPRRMRFRFEENTV